VKGAQVRAISFDDYGGVEVLHATDMPTPTPEPGSVRVRIAAAGVNPADYKWRQGMFKAFAPLPLPHVLGYDIAGVVDAVGDGVGSPKVGDRVFAQLPKGGYAEYAVLPAGDAIPIPDGLDFATAATLPTAGLTGVQLIEDHIQPAEGETVLITGAVGAVGRWAVVAALRRGARVVAAVRASQVEAARALGAAEVIVLGEADWSGAPFNHVADTLGGPAVARLCRHVAPGGRIRTAATTPIDPEGLPSEPMFIAVHSDPVMLGKIATAVANGRVAMPIARRLPLSAAAEAHRLLEAGGVGGKIILEP
jgi:NADPH:quinone reductase-like Zn-dependent oxidoreductase